MNKLILISGDLAAGKSTYSKILSDRFNTIVINKDNIKEILGDTIGFTNREENLKLSNATMRIMIYLFNKLAKLNKDLILEANFHEHELKEIFDDANKNNYDVMHLYLKGDNKILYDRFMNRINNENRHIVHQSAGLVDYDKFCDYLDTSRKENYGDVIYIDVNDFSYQQDENIFNNIKTFLEK